MANLVFDFLHNYHAGERRDSEPANAYQYDEGHVIEANLPQVITSCEIHYWIRGMEEAEAYVPTSITPNSDGTCTVIGHVPNEYFRTNGELRVYIVVTDGDASITTYEGRIQVCQRSMPDDYVDDDPENEATRVLIEAQEAAATATAAAETCEEVRESIPADYSQLSDDVDTLKDGLDAVTDQINATLITDTASGAIASFSDGADGVPVKSLTVDIEPVQSGSGDPSPDNVRPISGHTSAVVTRCGKNLFDGELLNGYYDTASGEFASSSNWRASKKIRCKPNTTYVMSGSTHATGGYSGASLFWDESGNYLGYRGTGNNFASYPNSAWMAFYTGAPTVTDTMQVEEGSIASTYEAYEGQTVTIDLDGTRYGGTLNVETGVLTVDRKYRLLNGVNGDGVTYNSNGHTTNTTRAFVRITDKAYGTNNMISSSFSYQASGDSVGMMNGRATGDGIEFYLNASVPNTEEGVKAWFAENQTDLVYELATPFTVQLTANEISTVLGQNNIWSDAGDTNVEYRADTKLYIKKLTGSTEEDMVADANIVSGQFFMVGNTLYKATANIASGGAITPNVNCTRKSLPEALNEINA